MRFCRTMISIKRKCGFEHGFITSSASARSHQGMLSVDIFFSNRKFCKQTTKTQIRLHNCAVQSDLGLFCPHKPENSLFSFLSGVAQYSHRSVFEEKTDRIRVSDNHFIFPALKTAGI